MRQGLAPGQSVGSDMGLLTDGRVLILQRHYSLQRVGSGLKVIAVELIVTGLMKTRKGLGRSCGRGPWGLPCCQPRCWTQRICVFVLKSLVSDFRLVHLMAGKIPKVLSVTADTGPRWVWGQCRRSLCPLARVSAVPPGHLGCPVQHHDGELRERDFRHACV